MATEVDQTYFAWSQEESTERDGSQGISVSQMLDHGSISFGRFEFESLSWEKWSVFTHDRRQEEFGKFNGLVAEKKAYFEEYYKKIRELKSLQQQNQQTELTLEYSGDGSDSSQTGEDEPAADFETPSGARTVVDNSMEQTTTETTCDQELRCYEDHENENLNTEFSSSAGSLQQTEQEIRENDSSDHGADGTNIVQQDANSGHDLGTAHEIIRPPRRTIEKDSRLRQAQKIIPKSVKTPSKNPLDHTVVSKGPGSVKPSQSLNQKTKPDNVRSLQRPKTPPQKMVGTADRSKLMAKEAAGVTSVRRPTSAASRRPSTGERRPVTRESMQKHADIATPCRPSTAERRSVNRESAQKHADIATPRRPSTGERRPVTRQSALKMDPKMPSRAGVPVAHPKGSQTTAGNPKKAVAPNAVKSSKPETKSSYVTEGLKRSLALDSRSTGLKRMELQVAGKPKSSSVNLPPRKKSSSTVGGEQRVLETFARPKKKEGNQEAVQSRAAAPKNIAPLPTGNAKARTPKPPPPPPPRRPSRTAASKPNANNSSVNGRKPKYATLHAHCISIDDALTGHGHGPILNRNWTGQSRNRRFPNQQLALAEPVSVREFPEPSATVPVLTGRIFFSLFLGAALLLFLFKIQNSG